MISTELARRFIERVTKYTDFNINIMNEQGIIIASRDPERIGQYHAIAHQIAQTGPDVIEVDQDDIRNVRRGINMVIETGGRREGVVGVTGAPEEIRAAALMTKMALETMLRYEQLQEEHRRRENRKEQFIYLLTQVADADHEQLRTLAADLGFPEEMVRIPILVKIEKESAEELLLRFRESRLHTKLDFSIAPDSSHVLIFKTIPDRAKTAAREEGKPGQSENARNDQNGRNDSNDRNEQNDRDDRNRQNDQNDQNDRNRQNEQKYPGNQKNQKVSCLRDYRDYLQEYLEDVCRPLTAAGAGLRFYIGSFQENYKQYYHSYRHCKWLETHVSGTEQVVFFYDHMNEYMQYITPMQELHNVFHIYEKRFPEKMRPVLVETILALQRCNFNFAQAAGELYVHKNTLVYRYNRIRELTGTDPVCSAQDRAFLLAFAVYLSRLS